MIKSNMDLKIRKIYTISDENLFEGAKKLSSPVIKATAVAVIENPFAGTYTEDLSLLYSYGEELGQILGEAAIRTLGISGEEVESYGKAAIVGINGELEHGHAIIHPRLGAPLRNLLGGAESCRAIIPSNVKVGNTGTSIDVPLHYKDSAWVVSHVDTMEVYIPDSPRDNEISVIVSIANSGRPLARTKGMVKSDV